MRLLRNPVAAVALALLLGVVLGAVAFVVTDRAPSAPRPPGGPTTETAPGEATTTVLESPEAAEALLAAWRRSRTADYVIDSRFVRETRAGGRLASTTRVVQRPPDRLTIGEDTVDGRLGGRRFACAADEDEVLRCRDGGEAPPYDTEVAREVAALERLVAGEQPLYGVGDEGEGCFALRLLYILHAPPYGVRARLCFDQQSGALVSSEIRREDSFDRSAAIEVRAEVTDDDLQLPPGARVEPG